MRTLWLGSLLILIVAPIAHADWNQWRGPTRDGVSPGKPFPSSLQGEDLKFQWRIPLGQGYPGPVVAKDRVFVAETKDRKFEIARALDRATGKQVWEHSWEGAMNVIFIAAPNGNWIRSTPAYDGTHLFVAGMRDVLVSIDAKTGKEAWRFDFTKEMKTPLPPFGCVSSPLVDEKAVYVQAGGCLAKLDKATGKLLWTALKDGGATYNSAFSSPIFADVQGKKQLIVQTRTQLAGVDPEKGDVLWSQDVPAFKNMNILTPVVHNGDVFTSTYGGKSFLYDIEKKAKGWAASTTWTNNQQAYMSSPVICGGFLYLHLKSQRFGCFDLKTGKERWITTERFGKYWSMAVRGDRMLALDERGILYLIKANPDRFDLVDERKVSDEQCWGHIAVDGDDVYIRELNGIAAYRLGANQK